MAIIGLSRKNRKVQVIKGDDPTIVGDQYFNLRDMNPSLIRFYEFWDFMETIQVHGYTRAAMSVFGRSAVGAWWTLRKHSEYEKGARELHRRRLYSFYMGVEDRSWDNIKDFYSFAYNIMIGVMYLRYFGRAAYHIVRNRLGVPIGMDFLPGLVIPNVDEEGYFKNPAFVQYLSKNPANKVEFENPKDIVYITNPDWRGSVLGASDIEALATYTLPLDIYLQTAASSYMQNRDRPEVIFQLASDIEDDSFDEFVKEMRARYSGATNVGRSPIAVQGELDVKELRRMPADLPYQDARKDTRDEVLAVSGTSSSKLGLVEDMTNSNLRELRREFHESSMIPLFRFVEIGLYEQVHVREFGYLDWEFRFNNPDFLNMVERATVHMRYHMMGGLNPNEIRYEIGKPPREDELGDMYYDELLNQPPHDQPGSPPEGREDEPDADEPVADVDDPIRGDQHDDETREDAMLASLRKWRRFALKRMKEGRNLRIFESKHIPAGLADIIQSYLEKARTMDDVAQVFDAVFEEV